MANTNLDIILSSMGRSQDPNFDDILSGMGGSQPGGPITITLGTLSLSTALTTGTVTNGSINGATSGSTITSNLAGLTVNSSARTFSYSGSTAGTFSTALTEALAGATNSPRNSPVTVASAAPTPMPTPTPGVADFPRMGMVGPSTVAHNNYATNSASILRGGNNAAGPITWLNATSPYRVQIINDFDTSNTKLYYGDNAAIGGLDFDAWPAQIDYLGTRLAGVPAARRWLNYELGRNGITRSLAEHKAALDRDIANARSKGFSKIFLNKLWFRTSATAGWEKGSANRQKIVDINAYIDQLVAAATDLYIVDLFSAMMDPSTGSGLDIEPYTDAVRNDGQHISSRGGRRASKPYATTLTPLVVAQTYPNPAPENKIPAMTGSGGVLGPATGEVYSGFTLTAAGSAITTVASRVTVGGKPYQRLAFSGMSGIGSSGASIEMRSDGFAATAGERVNWRCKLRIPANQNPYMFYAALEGGSNTTGARSVAFAPARSDLSTDEVVTTTGTTLTNGSVFNGASDTEDREFWLEGTLPVHVDVDGPLTVVVRFLLRASAVDFVAEIGEFQTFNWAG